MCYRAIIFLGFLLCSDFSHAEQPITQKGAFAQGSNFTPPTANHPASVSNLQVNGLVGGRVIERQNTIIIDGATLAGNGKNQPRIKVGSGGKRVILNNVNIVAQNSKAALVDITGDNVQVRNLRVRSHNNDVISKDCAAMICFKGNNSAATNVDATVSGKNNFSAGK